MDRSYALGFAALVRTGWMTHMLIIASGCGPGAEHKDNPPASSDQPVTRPHPKRLARNSELAHENEIGAPTNPVPTTPSLDSPSNVDLETTRTKAEAGDVAAQAALGNYYATGQRGRIDLSQAVKWYRAAAEQGE